MEFVSRKLKEIDIDVDSVVSRLGGNELLYLSICSKYLKDQSFKYFHEAITKNDYLAAEYYIHTLKGIAANLGFIRMEALCKSIFEDLKRNEYINLQTNMIVLGEEQNRIISVINEEQT